MMDVSQITVSQEGGAGIVRFARPEARNALTDTMLAETSAQLEMWEQDRSIAAVVVTGDEKAFCAGGDLKGTASATMPAFDKYRHRYTTSEWHNFMRFLGQYTKPVIAAIEGYALGGGLEIVLRCDFCVGSETAKLGLTEAKLGLFPILGGAWSLTRAIGEKRARELAYTGRRIGADEAKEIGILNHVVPAGQAVDKAVEIAAEIAANAPLAVMASKQAINRAPRQTYEEALNAGGDLSALLMFSNDRKEGLAAFAEKRKPEFKGE
jgi:enoyl-CoA hydratase/carnithine racemase